jgi:hypothetical protein
VKVPLQPLQGPGDSAKRDDSSVSSILLHDFQFFRLAPFSLDNSASCFHSAILPDFPHSESSAPAPRMTAGRAVRICAPMHRKIQKTTTKFRRFLKRRQWQIKLPNLKNAKQAALQAKSYEL